MGGEWDLERSNENLVSKSTTVPTNHHITAAAQSFCDFIFKHSMLQLYIIYQDSKYICIFFVKITHTGWYKMFSI